MVYYFRAVGTVDVKPVRHAVAVMLPGTVAPSVNTKTGKIIILFVVNLDQSPENLEQVLLRKPLKLLNQNRVHLTQ